MPVSAPVKREPGVAILEPIVMQDHLPIRQGIRPIIAADQDRFITVVKITPGDDDVFRVIFGAEQLIIFVFFRIARIFNDWFIIKFAVINPSVFRAVD